MDSVSVDSSVLLRQPVELRIYQFPKNKQTVISVIMSQTEYSIQLENISAKLQESFKFKFDNSEKQVVWSKMFWTYLSHQTFCDALYRINSLALDQKKKLTFEEKSLSNYDMLALL